MASVTVHMNDVIEDEVVTKLCATQYLFLGLYELSLIGMSTPTRFEAAIMKSDMLRKRRILRDVVLISFHEKNDVIIVKDPSTERQHITPTRDLLTSDLAHSAYGSYVVWFLWEKLFGTLFSATTTC